MVSDAARIGIGNVPCKVMNLTFELASAMVAPRAGLHDTGGLADGVPVYPGNEKTRRVLAYLVYDAEPIERWPVQSRRTRHRFSGQRYRW